jgi:hypothetical protein
LRPYLEKNLTQKGLAGMAQGERPEFKTQYCKKIKEKS